MILYLFSPFPQPWTSPLRATPWTADPSGTGIWGPDAVRRARPAIGFNARRRVPQTFWRLVLSAAALLCAACSALSVPVVPETEYAFEPALPDTDWAMRMKNEWMLFSHPAEMYGLPVLRAPAGSQWTVTGRWHAETPLEGDQWWVLVDYRDWYRLNAELPPYGRVSLWGQLPADWMVEGTADDIPWVDPAPGVSWSAVPYSQGVILAPRRDATLHLRLCPSTACPVLERPARGDAVPVTGRLEDGEGRPWYRVEFRQAPRWVDAAGARLRLHPSAWLRPGRWRSCEPVVMFPPPPHTLCAVDEDGRFQDKTERRFDQLDPIYGRLPLPRD